MLLGNRSLVDGGFPVNQIGNEAMKLHGEPNQEEKCCYVMKASTNATGAGETYKSKTTYQFCGLPSMFGMKLTSGDWIYYCEKHLSDHVDHIQGNWPK